jgi:hypothetical protein
MGNWSGIEGRTEAGGQQVNKIREAPAFRSARPWVWLPCRAPRVLLFVGIMWPRPSR